MDVALLSIALHIKPGKQTTFNVSSLNKQLQRTK